MKDQAEQLRQRLNALNDRGNAKAIAVISGKGGVGKSNFSLNFSLSLSKQGASVLLFDMDIGMGNIDILMGLSPRYSIVDMLSNQYPIDRIIEKGPANLSFVAGGTGLAEIFELDRFKFAFFINQLEAVSKRYDYLIFDMGAGVTNDSLRFILSAQEIVVITTPEPTSITDAYAAIKYVSMREQNLTYRILVNRASSEKEGKSTQDRLVYAVKHFLNKTIHPLGILPDDRSLQKAVIHQAPFLIDQPHSKVSKAMERIAADYMKSDHVQQPIHNGNHFISKLKRYFFERNG